MNQKILIVDDKKEYIQTVMNFILKEAIPHALLCAPNGKVAIEIARIEQPDIIIMDWEMPEMNGIEAIKYLKQLPETMDIPVILATGIRLTPVDLKEAFEAGASDFIRKPLEETEFLARMNSHLNLAKYIKTIRQQQDVIAVAQQKNLNEKISELKNRVAENETHRKYFKDILETVVKRLEEVEINDDSIKSEINQIISKLHISVKNFGIIQTNTNTPDDNFVRNLLARFSNLTPQEIQLSYMIRNNLSSKEIASITFREEASVKVARSRLRKKIELEPDTNLSNFLQQF